MFFSLLGPFDREVSAQLRLTNHTDKHICFKFETGHCTVQPEFGKIGPGKAVVTAGKLFNLASGSPNRKAIKVISKK